MSTGDDDERAEIEIVGVVGDVVQNRAEEGWLPAVYVPYTQADWPIAQVLVRSTRDPSTLFPDVKRSVARFSGFIVVRGLAEMSTRIRSVHTEPRFHAFLIGGFAAVAILLAAIGLYGSLAYSVRCRTTELGIRMALGASGENILRLILRRGLWVAGIGLGLGLAGAVGLTQLIRSFLFGVGALDAMSFAIAAAVLVTAALLASAVPARRAAAVDVIRSLKAD
jgi:ABC-type antimicrobial peptide transport system permease subunit